MKIDFVKFVHIFKNNEDIRNDHVTWYTLYEQILL